jgi:hypothetical protein
MSLTIYHGLTKPIKVTGKHQTKLLDFAYKYKGWHSYANDSITRRTVSSLVKKGYIEINEFNQFRFTFPKG